MRGAAPVIKHAGLGARSSSILTMRDPLRSSAGMRKYRSFRRRLGERVKSTEAV
jgi:hypothetical protein